MVSGARSRRLMSVMPVPRMATSVAAHAGTSLQRRAGCSPTNAARSSAEVLDGRGAGHHHQDVARAGVGVPAAARPRTGLGRARPRGGAGRPWAADGRARRAMRRPGRAPGRHLRHRQRRRHRPRTASGSRPASAVSRRRAARAAPYSSGARKRGTQPSPTAAARRRAAVARPPEPQRDRGRDRLLHVVGARLVWAGPGPPQPGDALVHEPAAPAVVDAGPHVLGLVDAHADARGRSVHPRGAGGRWPAWPRPRSGRRGSWRTQVPSSGRAGRDGGHGQRGERLADGVGPVEVVHGPQRVRPGRLGPAAQLGDLGGRSRYVLWVLPTVGREFSLRGGGEDEPEGGSRRSTSYRGHTDIVRRRPGL